MTTFEFGGKKLDAAKQADVAKPAAPAQGGVFFAPAVVPKDSVFSTKNTTDEPKPAEEKPKSLFSSGFGGQAPAPTAEPKEEKPSLVETKAPASSLFAQPSTADKPAAGSLFSDKPAPTSLFGNTAPNTSLFDSKPETKAAEKPSLFAQPQATE